MVSPRPSCISSPVSMMRLAAELAHADIEGDARAGRGLVEDHRQHLALERALACGVALARAAP